MFILKLTSVFKWIFMTSIYASILILFILALKSIFKNRLNSKWHYAIWYLMILYLIIPFNIKTNFKLYTAIQPHTARIEKTVNKALASNIDNVFTKENKLTPDTKISGIHNEDVDAYSSKNSIDNSQETQQKNDVLDTISITWFSVLLILLSIIIISNINFYKHLKNENTLINEDIIKAFNECKDIMGIKIKINIIKLKSIKSPALHGLTRPTIILPHKIGNKLNVTDLKYIFLHELSHLKRKDILINYLITIIQITYWFNPLIYYAFYKMKQDREIVCDSLALSYLDNNENRDYGNTIIKLIEGFSYNSDVILTAGILEKTSNIKRRLIKIINFKKEKNKISLIGMSILVIIAIFLLTIPKNYIAGKVKDTFKDIKPDDEVVLTINQDIQRVSEDALKKAIVKNNAKGGTIIVMDTQTGKILSFVNMSKDNLNKTFIPAKKYKDNPIFNDISKNYGITNSSDAGSILKCITTAAALNESKVSLKDNFNCKGYIKVTNRIIRCMSKSHGKMNLVEAFQNSCNCVFIEIGQKLGYTKFYKYTKDFGFGEKTGIDIPGESIGIVPNDKKFGLVEHSLQYLGQSINCTNLQMLNAINCIANGGKLMRPYVIQNVIRDNEVISETEPKIMREVISKDTSDKVTYLMEKNVEGGIAIKAKTAGLRIACKTGTTPKLDPVKHIYLNSAYLASACGFAPANNPKVSIIVCIDQPTPNNYLAGSVAAPAFKEVITNSMKYLK